MYRQGTTVGGAAAILTSGNEAYGKVIRGEEEEEYELVDISQRELPPPVNVGQIPSLPPPSGEQIFTVTTHEAETEGDAVYDVIAGDI